MEKKGERLHVCGRGVACFRLCHGGRMQHVATIRNHPVYRKAVASPTGGMPGQAHACFKKPGRIFGGRAQTGMQRRVARGMLKERACLGIAQTTPASLSPNTTRQTCPVAPSACRPAASICKITGTVASVVRLWKDRNRMCDDLERRRPVLTVFHPSVNPANTKPDRGESAHVSRGTKVPGGFNNGGHEIRILQSKAKQTDVGD